MSLRKQLISVGGNLTPVAAMSPFCRVPWRFCLCGASFAACLLICFASRFVILIFTIFFPSPFYFFSFLIFLSLCIIPFFISLVCLPRDYSEDQRGKERNQTAKLPKGRNTDVRASEREHVHKRGGKLEGRRGEREVPSLLLALPLPFPSTLKKGTGRGGKGGA